MSVPKNIPGYRRTLFSFKVMHCGWECDEDGWIVELRDGRIVPVLENHCRPYIASLDELQEKLAKYRRVVADTERAIRTVAQA